MRIRSMLAGAAACAAMLLSQTAHAVTVTPPSTQKVLIAEDEGLYAYDQNGLHLMIQTLHSETTSHIGSEYVKGPPCFIPNDPKGRFLEADDNPGDGGTFNTTTNQWEGGFNGDAKPFFGLFDNDGTRDYDSAIGDQGRVGDLAGMQDPAGCAFDSSGNLFGIDVGENHLPLGNELEPITSNFMSGRPGQVIEFFAPDYKTFCVLDSNLSQPGMVTFDSSGALLVPEAGFGQIVRYAGFPSAPGAGCAAGVQKSIWLAGQIGTPIGIVHDPSGGYAVSSVLVPPTIFHVSDAGLVDGVYALPSFDQTGTPFGLGFDSNGDLFYADLGVRPFPLDGTDPTDPIDSAPDLSSFKVIPAAGSPALPQAPQTIQGGWEFADGVTVVNASQVSLTS